MAQLYTPLKSNLCQIRRLVLEPAVSFDDPLHGHLDVVSLESNPGYEALSYVWGSFNPPKTINLNGRLISITPNLDNALRNLRFPKSPRILWVDALCINQDDLDERAAQVALMRRVYSDATTVLIWLGPEAEGSEEAMRSVQRFDKGYWQTYEFQTQFMEILFRPWFTRIWTVQEFVMARHSVVDGRMKNPLLVVGVYGLSEWLPFITAWAHFSDDGHIIQEKYNKAYHDAITKTFQPEWIQLAPSIPVEARPTSLDGIITGLRSAFGEDFFQNLPFSSLRDLEEDIQLNPLVWRARYTVMRHCQYDSTEGKAFWRRMKLMQRVPITYHGFLMHSRGTIHIRKEALTLETVLKGTMNLRSTDPRDKIYGILGLLSEEARAAIPIDYHKEPEWTFVPTMAYVIHHEPKGLALLGLLWRTRQFKTPLPSWVPDFTISADFNDEHNPVFLRGSCADHEWEWSEDTRAMVLDKTTLSAHMINFGRVTHIISFIDGDRSYYVSRFAEIEAILSIHAPKNEPLWRTLVGIRNTDHDLIVTYPTTFEVLMGRSEEKDGEAQKMFQDAILPIVRGRKFFITDKGFAGIATPMIRNGDMIATIAGMGRVAILRDTDPKEIGLEGRIDDGRQYQRIIGFAYVGCHDRDGFELVKKENVGDRRRHGCCDRDFEECDII